MPTFTSADSTSTPTGSSRDWEPSARLVQLLQQVWQDRVCQSYEPPEHGACLLGTQSFLSLAERSAPQIMSMHKTLSVKSRVRGDFHARFWERVRVKLPRSTRSWPSDVFQHEIRVLFWQKRVGKFRKISSFSLCGAFFIPILQISPNKSLLLQSQLLAESPNGWNAGIDTYIHKGVSCALVLTICELRNFKFLSRTKQRERP